jgi:uncharacterized surface protein with fasciclin (FAS1) repeats
MRSSLSRTALALLAALALIATACEVDDTEEPLVDDTPDDQATPEETPVDEPEPPGLESDEDATVVELLAGHEAFSQFVAAIEQAGLEAQLSGDGPYTVFAPVDEGFAILPEHERDQLAEDLDLLEQRVLGHVAEGELAVDELSDGDTITMLDGTERQVLVTDDGDIFVGAALVLEADAQAANGVVHPIDFVLPSTPAEPDEQENGEDEDDEDDNGEDA